MSSHGWFVTCGMAEKCALWLAGSHLLMSNRIPFPMWLVGLHQSSIQSSRSFHPPKLHITTHFKMSFYTMEQQLELSQYENKLMKLSNERLEREVDRLRWEVGLQKQHVASLEAMVFGAVHFPFPIVPTICLNFLFLFSFNLLLLYYLFVFIM